MTIVRDAIGNETCLLAPMHDLRTQIYIYIIYFLFFRRTWKHIVIHIYIYMSFKLQYYKDYTKIRNTSMIRYKSHCNTEHILDKCIRLLAVCLKNMHYTSYVKRRPNNQLIKACKKILWKSNDRAHIHFLCPQSAYNKYTTVIRLTYCNWYVQK